MRHRVADVYWLGVEPPGNAARIDRGRPPFVATWDEAVHVRGDPTVSEDTADTCALCGERLSASAVTAEDDTRYCSDGCREVATTLPEAPDEGSDGLEATASTLQGTGSRGNGEGSAEDDPGSVEATFLRVEGMHCATCEAFLEDRAESTPGVVGAEASYVTETVGVEYDPAVTSPEALCERLTTLGYTARPRESSPVDSHAMEGDRHDPTVHPRERERGFDDLIGYRYAAGVLFASFLLLPYVVSIYPAHLGELLGIEWLAAFGTEFGFSTLEGLLMLPFFLFITGVVLLFAGMPLLRGALVSLRMRQPNTDLLVATTLAIALAYSTLAALLGRTDVFFDATVVIAAVVVAAIFYETLVKRRAMDRLTDLTVSRVSEATRYGPDGTTWTVAVEELAPGDRVLVREGERVPVDGTVEEGPCAVDEAVVTGESLPVTKRAGDEVLGGSIVTEGAAILRIDDAVTSSIDRLTATVWELQRADHGVQRRADRLASIALPVVAVLGVIAAGAAYALGAAGPVALLAGLGAVLVASPWAVGLATPLSVATNIRAALERGIVVFDETIFERLRDVDVVVFDKTGTLTTGRMTVFEADAPEDLLAAAGALEARAAHPAAVAIADAFGPRQGDESTDGASTDGGRTVTSDATVERFESHARGVSGTVDGASVLVGAPSLFADRNWTVPADLASRADAARDEGRLPVLVGRDGAAEGIVVVGDSPRDDWDATVAALADAGREVVVLTGDDRAAAASIADHPGVAHVFAGIGPAGKTATVRRLQARGSVAMVGDGTNDAPALAAADLGISLGGGTALAADAADVTVLDDDLSRVQTAFDLARAAGTRTRQTLWLAGSYNAVAIPAAVAGILSPLTLAGAITVCGVLVGANAWRPLLSK